MFPSSKKKTAIVIKSKKNQWLKNVNIGMTVCTYIKHFSNKHLNNHKSSIIPHPVQKTKLKPNFSCDCH